MTVVAINTKREAPSSAATEAMRDVLRSTLENEPQGLYENLIFYAKSLSLWVSPHENPGRAVAEDVRVEPAARDSVKELYDHVVAAIACAKQAKLEGRL